MERHELEHLIRAAAAVTNQYELIVIGSQSILGAIPNAPSSLRESMEADLYPRGDPSLADLIDGAIGESSPFHERFGYYGQGVGPDTAVLPEGWESRLVKIQSAGTDLKIGWCLEPHDLAASKLVAGREKDWIFVSNMLSSGLIAGETLGQRVMTLPVHDEVRNRLLRWVQNAAHVEPSSDRTRPRP